MLRSVYSSNKEFLYLAKANESIKETYHSKVAFMYRKKDNLLIWIYILNHVIV